MKLNISVIKALQTVNALYNIKIFTIEQYLIFDYEMRITV